MLELGVVHQAHSGFVPVCVISNYGIRKRSLCSSPAVLGTPRRGDDKEPWFREGGLVNMLPL